MTFALTASDGIDVGAIWRDVLAKHQAKHAWVWRECQMDGAQFSRSLSALAPLDLWRLIRLARSAPELLTDYFEALAVAVVHYHFNEIQLPLRMAKAQLPESERKEKSA